MEKNDMSCSNTLDDILSKDNKVQQEVGLVKIFTGVEEQIRIQAERGLTISDDDATQRKILMCNYYNLFNGYKTPFLESNNGTNSEIYKNGAKFSELCALYELDRELRGIFLSAALEIENSIKSIIAHVFSREEESFVGKSDNYLKISSFVNEHDETEKNTENKAAECSELIGEIHRIIAKKLRNGNPMINHHMEKYGYIPPWVMLNVLSLSVIIKFYKCMRSKDKNDVGKYFNSVSELGIKPHEMCRVLSILNSFRNVCAHDERLYNHKVTRKNETLFVRTKRYEGVLECVKYIEGLDVTIDESHGTNDFFSAVIVCKLMMEKESFEHFYRRLKRKFECYKKKFYTISMEDLLELMGFPKNWKNISESNVK